MRSLRARLTIAYGAVTWVVLAILLCALTLVALIVATRPLAQAVDATTARARALAEANPGVRPDFLLMRLARDGEDSGVFIMQMHRFANGNARFAMPGPPLFAQLPAGGPLGPHGPPFMGEHLKTLLGVRDQSVEFDGVTVLIRPDIRRLNALAQDAGEALALALALAAIVAWLFGRWIAAQAVTPLTSVTSELRRFASGDFTPR